MGLSWISGTPNQDVSYLLSRRAYKKAIEVATAQLKNDPSNVLLRQLLADAYACNGQVEEAVATLDRLADDFAAGSFYAKAVAILKKIDRLSPGRSGVYKKLTVLIPKKEADEQRKRASLYNRKLVELSEPPQAPPQRVKITPSVIEPEPQYVPYFDSYALDSIVEVPGPPRPKNLAPESFEHFEILGLPPQEEPGQSTAAQHHHSFGRDTATGATIPTMLTNALFDSFDEQELLSLINGFELRTFDPGDVIISEGEPGDSLYIVTSGHVKVWVRDSTGHYGKIRELSDGAFFGEISIVSLRLRTATITAASRCELLMLDRGAINSICSTHPKVRFVLQQFADDRLASPEERQVRQSGTSPT